MKTKGKLFRKKYNNLANILITASTNQTPLYTYKLRNKNRNC